MKLKQQPPPHTHTQMSTHAQTYSQLCNFATVVDELMPRGRESQSGVHTDFEVMVALVGERCMAGGEASWRSGRALLK